MGAAHFPTPRKKGLQRITFGICDECPQLLMLLCRGIHGIEERVPVGQRNIPPHQRIRGRDPRHISQRTSPVLHRGQVVIAQHRREGEGNHVRHMTTRR